MKRALIAAGAALAFTAPAIAREKPVDLVDPFVGTLADFGQLSPAAVAPYGMVQLGPDTNPANHAGYDYAARSLRGFSHTRAVGVGCGGGGGDLLVSLLPEGAGALVPLDKASERAGAGRYRVIYANGITADMTATRGAGLLRFTVAQTGRYMLRFDAAHAYTRRHAARLTAEGTDLQATLTAGTVCDEGAYTIHSASRITVDGTPRAATGTITGNQASLALDLRRGAVVEVRTGLSTVDAAAAAGVRDTELGTRSFATVLAGTRARWQRELSRVRIDASREQRALFYTSLFRVMQTPVAIDDPDGRHRGSDGQVHRSAPGTTRYASWALWDNYRTQMPLIAILDPDRAADIARSLVALYGEGKQRWSTRTEPFLTVRTEHAGVALLDFYRRGIRGFDARAALAGMVRESETLQRDTPDQQIEAAYDDWAVAELAGELGEQAITERFRAKALSYRKMWRSVFENLGPDADVVKARGLYQGTLWQYRWAPVFDLDWMVATLGKERFLRELDRFFADGLYNMTNQPDIHAPWLYAALGRPDKTRDLVHRYLTEPVDHPYTNAGKRPVPFRGHSFALAPQGYADGMDDDAGAMSAWYVFGALGFYPLVPGKPDLVTTAPLGKHADIAAKNPRGTSRN
ncbi:MULTISPECIES: glycoside hydrolase domain-containing protein [Sphingomonas]|uniref:Glycoside hydrolase domain-containing protein n=1 Tax=Sphingomonas molluscorum TaxID=418184 RepID=A0ABU8PZX6_9SPHN|nr:glycoside hydrolase domain-containing protein [Sphingomonas sp. JUb134]MBM7404537.1 putative alpha-1,2-mannosidase [Sphingomonas sp. JUb134]